MGRGEEGPHRLAATDQHADRMGRTTLLSQAGVCNGLNCVPPKPCVESFSPVPENVTVLETGFLKR